MFSRLEPLSEGADAIVTVPFEQGSFAIISRTEMEALARTMPDSQSAVLLCVAWHAAVQVRMRRGTLAGRRVARVSATRLVEITGRPLRTVRYAISKLCESGAIVLEDPRPGRTSVYRLSFWDSTRPQGNPEVVDECGSVGDAIGDNEEH